MQRSRWAIVLAAGDGTRLSRLTTLGDVPVPKQFCMLADGSSLLDLAVERAQGLVPAANVVSVVAEAHREFWGRELVGLAEGNVVVQPSNRGTAAGVLLPLLSVYERDPEARVVLVPSDHWVEREETLAEGIEAAFRASERDTGGSLVLVAVEPDGPDTGYGWIVPGPRAGGSLRRVDAFVEKPGHALAKELWQCGAVWNTFLVVGSVKAFLALYRRRLPGLLWGMRTALDAERVFPGAVRAYYAELTATDFSRNVLQGAEDSLLLITAPACGWNDLGTPERVAACVRRLASGSQRPRVPVQPGRVDLARAVAAAS
jgi:mannose-1-phosphate guanylyltransferase